MCESGGEVEPVEKCCKVSRFITVTHSGICTVVFVLFTDLINTRVLPSVDKRRK